MVIAPLQGQGDGQRLLQASQQAPASGPRREKRRGRPQMQRRQSRRMTTCRQPSRCVFMIPLSLLALCQR